VVHATYLWDPPSYESDVACNRYIKYFLFSYTFSSISEIIKGTCMY
jgi:hypothetical protein